MRNSFFGGANDIKKLKNTTLMISLVDVDRLLKKANLEQYKPVQQLGKGSVGTVFKIKLIKRATDPIKEYALKIIELTDFSDKDLQNLKSYYSSLKKCCPSCVVNVYPHLIKVVGEGKKYLLIGSDILPHTLEDIKGWEPCKSLRIIFNLALCLKRLLDNRFLYTDLKPSNIGLTADFKPVILDLGGFAQVRDLIGVAPVQINLLYIPPEWKDSL